MSIDLLDAPLRVSWDLHDGSGAMPAAVARTVAAELGGGGVFFVTLEERPLAHPEIGEVLSGLAAHGCRTLVTCRGSEAELAALEHAPPVHALFLDTAPFIEAGEADLGALGLVLARLRDEGYDPGLLLTPRRDNFFLIPPLLDFCRVKGVGKFKLPNTRYDDSLRLSRGAPLLRPEDLRRLDRQLRGRGALHRRGVALEVHDLFLWELFYPERDEGRSEYGGCQAGNSIGHVDAGGTLYPCSSWPEPIGSLLESSLTDLWDSPRRHRVRRRIAREPSGCSGCRDFELCLGGCRGLAEALSERCGGRDPLCEGPR